MRVAISTDGNLVSAHFGRCPSFTIVIVENGKLIAKQIIPNPGHHPGFLPEFLKRKGVDSIVAGGMGQRAKLLFDQAGIQTILGISGEIDQIIHQIVKGTLAGGQSLCHPGSGKGYGIEKAECDHSQEEE